MQINNRMIIFMARTIDLSNGSNIQAGFFAALPDDAIFDALAEFTLSAGEFGIACQFLSGLSRSHQVAAMVFDDRDSDLLWRATAH